MALKEELLRRVAAQQEQLHNAQEICPGLYLGSKVCSEDTELLSRLQIGRVLSVGCHLSPSLPDGVLHKRFDVRDDEKQTLEPTLLLDGCQYIHEGVTSGHGVLVHCEGGISRSPSLCVAYLMVHHGQSYQEAFDHVKARRTFICPTPAFRKQLQAFEEVVVKRREEGGPT